MTRAAAALAFVAAVAAAAAGCASPAPGSLHGAPATVPCEDPVVAAAAFGRLAALAGTWKGTFGAGEQAGESTITYRVVGAGSAVEEVLFGGTDHEMVTLYHRDGPRLLLTHYCAAGNQPTMALVAGADPARPRFDFVRATNLSRPGAGHMHRAEFDLSDPERVVAVWTYAEDGALGHAARFDLRRAK
jgi:hypothetical protein